MANRASCSAVLRKIRRHLTKELSNTTLSDWKRHDVDADMTNSTKSPPKRAARWPLFGHLLAMVCAAALCPGPSPIEVDFTTLKASRTLEASGTFPAIGFYTWVDADG